MKSRIMVPVFGLVAALFQLNFQTSIQADNSTAASCGLLPLGLSFETLKDQQAGEVFDEIQPSGLPGHFLWLSWNGDPSSVTLENHLNDAAETYVNPEDPEDHVLNRDDWVYGHPGLSISGKVRDALSSKIGADWVLPVWEESRGEGSHLQVRVLAFARVHLLEAAFTPKLSIRFTFLGFTACNEVNLPPFLHIEYPPSIRLPESATLEASTEDDQLPYPPVLFLAWEQIDGPASTFLSSNGATRATAAFPEPGLYTFVCRASDWELTTEREFSIEVLPPNQPPSMNDLTLVTLEDAPLEIVLEAYDPDDDVLTFEILEPPRQGQILAELPEIVYQPLPDVHGEDSFRVTVTDGHHPPVEAAIRVEIQPVNDAPQTVDQSLSLLEDQAANLLLLGWDVEDDPLSFHILQSPAHGYLEGTPPALIYVPDPDYYGPDEFVFVADDGMDPSSPSTFALQVIPVNDPPRIQAESGRAAFSQEKILVQATVTDDQPPEELTFTCIQVSGPGASTLILATNEFAVIASFPVAGEYEIAFHVHDGEYSASDMTVVQVAPRDGNQPPIVDAGPDQSIAGRSIVHLKGEIYDDGLLAPLFIRWHQLTGSEAVGFYPAPSSLTPSIELPAPGTYDFALEAFDGEFSVQDATRVTFFGTNAPPRVLILSAQPAEKGSWILQGQVIDDGFPQPVKLSWSCLNHPGAVRFETPASARTRAWFVGQGQYFIQLSAFDGGATGSATTVLEVQGNQPPKVHAGPNLEIEITGSQSLPAARSWMEALPPTWHYEIANPGVDSFIVSHGLAASNADVVFAAGNFGSSGGDITIQRLAEWECGTWKPLDDPSRPGLEAPYGAVIAEAGGILYAGGGFFQDLAEPPDGHMDATAYWDGSRWSPWNFKLLSPNITINALHGFRGGMVVGGQFLAQPASFSAGLEPLQETPYATNLIFWDGMNWQTLGGGISDDRDEGGTLHGQVLALASGSTSGEPEWLFAGGRFQMRTAYGLAENLASWNGIDWAPLEADFEGCFGFKCTPEIRALLIEHASETLYVGGNFKSINGIIVNGIAAGTFDPALRSWSWRALGDGFNIEVNALAWWNDTLFAGGRFTQSGNTSLSRAAQWDGFQWRPLANDISQGVNSDVTAMIPTSNGVVLGGFFTMAGGLPASRVARWGHATHPRLSGPQSFAVANLNDPIPLSLSLTSYVHHSCPQTLTVTWWLNGAEIKSEELQLLSSAAPGISMVEVDLPTGWNHILVLAQEMDNGRAFHEFFVRVDSRPAVQLLGSVTDDLLPADQLALEWSLSPKAPPLGGFFSSPHSPSTTFHPLSPGTYVLRLTASDGEFVSFDEAILQVTESERTNAPPTIHMAEYFTSEPGASVLLEATVTDDGWPSNTLTVDWTQEEGPSVAILEKEGPWRVSAKFPYPGRYVIIASANDSQLATYASVVVDVFEKANQPPSIQAPSRLMLETGSPAIFAYEISDDNSPWGILTSELIQTAGPSLLDWSQRNGTTYLSGVVEGTYYLLLQVSDGSLSAEHSLRVDVVSTANEPFASITFPSADQTVTRPIDLLGTIQMDHLLRYELQYRKPGLEWTTFHAGTHPMTEGVMGTLDPTQLSNGFYELQAKATDLLGRSVSSKPLSIVVEGRLKLGSFNLSFTDMVLPAPGLPLEIVRTYDSLNQENGDFGPGWKLHFNGIRIEKNGALHSGWKETTEEGLFPVYSIEPERLHQLAVIYPDGRVYRFVAIPEPTVQFGIPITYPRMNFMPARGAQGTLTAVHGTELVVSGSIPGPVDLFDLTSLLEGDLAFEYDPTLFEYTDRGGNIYHIDTEAGMQKIQDRNGHSLTLAPEGILHSSGKTLLFTRNPDGFITRIADLSGKSVQYHYDEQNRLATVVDREGRRIQFIYQDNGALLLSMVNDQGHVVLENTYDEAGRLLVQNDATGSRFQYQHDLLKNRQTIVDPSGGITRLEFDNRGNVVRSQDPTGAIRTFVYGDLDRKIQMVDPHGAVTSFRYDSASGHISAITNALGHVHRFSHNQQGQLTEFILPSGATWSAEYDDAGRLLRCVNPLQQEWICRYDEQGNRIGMTNPLGETSHAFYGSSGHLLITSNRLGHSTSFLHDDSGRLIESITHRTHQGHPEWITNRWIYNGNDELVQTIHPDLSSESTTYHISGLPESETDPAGRVTRYSYDLQGRLLQTFLPSGDNLSLQRDAAGRISSLTTANGAVYELIRDSAGRVTQILLPDGGKHFLNRDPTGRIVTTTNPRGFSTYFQYDALGQLVAVTNALGEVNYFHYDAVGNLVSRVDPLGRITQFHYDLLNRLIQKTFPDGSHVSWQWDPLGRLIEQTNETGQSTRFSYDAAGNLVKVIGPDSEDVEFTHDELGNIVTQTDPNGHVTSYQYDSMGRRILRMLPLGFSERIHYDAGGNLLAHVDFEGRMTRFVYDESNRLTARYPDPSLSEPPSEYKYDAEGRLILRTEPAGEFRFDYDSSGRRTAKHTPVGSLFYTYDANGNLVSIRSSIPNGLEAKYRYDALDRLVEVTDPVLGQTTYSYDPAGRVVQQAMANGLVTRYEYDLRDRITSIHHQQLNGTLIASFEYELSPSGQILLAQEFVGHSTRPHRLISWEYDETSRLVQETLEEHDTKSVIRYTYDPAGNRLTVLSSEPSISSRTFLYDANDRLTEHQYDRNGNTLFSEQNNPITGTAAIVQDTYDSRNRLMDRDEGAVHFLYDDEGLPLLRSTPDSVSFYLYDDLNPTGLPQLLQEMELTASGMIASKVYQRGLSLISLDRFNGEEWEAKFYAADRLGSTRILTSDQGVATDSYQFDAFGNLLNHTGEDSQSFLFAGEWFDADLGLYFLRARYMNPALGRFHTMDRHEGTAARPLSLHKYAYAEQDPVNRIDPTGFSTSLPEATVSTSIASSARAALMAFTSSSMKCWTVSAGYGAMVGGAVGATTGAGIEALIQLFEEENSPGDIGLALARGARDGGISGAIDGFAIANPFTLGAYLAYSSSFSLDQTLDTLLDPTAPPYLKYLQASTFVAHALPLLSPNTARRLSDLLSRKFCFAPGTLVATPNGSVPIETLAPGDLVWSTQPGTLATEPAAVTAVFTNLASCTVQVTLGNTELFLTPDHPVWIEHAGWMPARMLEPGLLLRDRNGRLHEISSVAAVEEPSPTYNLEISPNQTFYVSPLEIWVHNACNSRWQYITSYHNTKATEIFGEGLGRQSIGGRHYDKLYKGKDIEFKSDNFQKGPRHPSELLRMQSQINKDIMNKNLGLANPHWHFLNNPGGAPEMLPLLSDLEKAGITWTFGPTSPF